MSTELFKLQYISLCSKVTQELDNHTGIRDKILAEYIINLCKGSASEKDFLMKLEDNDANFTSGFSSSLYNLINKMLPKEKASKNKEFIENLHIEDNSFEKAIEKEEKDVKLLSAKFF